MKQYKQSEVAKLERVQSQSVSRWTEEELLGRGWTKHGEGNGCHYTREQDKELDSIDRNMETRANLEIRKCKADIALKEQKIGRDRRLLFQEWSDKFIEVFLDSFSPLKDLLSEGEFKQEDADKWNKAIDICLKKLQKSSENIYKSVDIEAL